MSGPFGARVPQEAYAVALATLPEVGPSRLRALLHRSRPDAAWAQVLAGLKRDHGGQWQRIAHDMDVQALWDAHRQCGVGVALRGSPSYPAKLSRDPQAPAVLFHRGDPTIADRYPTVAVVGTRSATRYGLGLAAQFGAELTASGVSVISGLSLGIDGAAHEGACGATGVTRTPVSASPVAAITPQHGPTPALPLAVVAGGLDSPCPRRHIGLWERVASCGAVVSEPPIGTGEQGWRFPQRNRILAARTARRVRRSEPRRDHENGRCHGQSWGCSTTR